MVQLFAGITLGQYRSTWILNGNAVGSDMLAVGFVAVRLSCIAIAHFRPSGQSCEYIIVLPSPQEEGRGPKFAHRRFRACACPEWLKILRAIVRRGASGICK